jgi:hypothetical protein
VFSRPNSFQRELGRDNVLRLCYVGKSRRVVRVSEIGTNMLLLSAFEDFVSRTLAATPGKLRKLLYLGSLHRDGQYHHWGLARAHGHAAANAAMADSHTSIWLDVLRTPIANLHSEMQSLREGPGQGSPHWLKDAAALVPENRAGGTERHFNSILLALSLLSKAGRRRNRQAS